MSQPTTRKTRSTLEVHQIPNFYACYLLKSVRTPRATATYIGSTPHPPRRIRQHNGEIAAGAWKTKHNRPWVMQMIIYGFPSKLAALQFEWAWQHPHISRHLRDADGKSLFAGDKKSKTLKASAKVGRMMVTNPPYTTWPLHAKLFTAEAVKLWDTFNKDASVPALPRGFTTQVELEGVDGKSGHTGSGRTGPLDVSDITFTTAHLVKHNAVVVEARYTCAVCRASIDDYRTAPLNTALCTNERCTAVSHLSCLGRHFSAQDPGHVGIVPRGGDCPGCGDYLLWGDLVRGCYRRHAGGTAKPESEADEGSEASSSSGSPPSEASDGEASPKKVLNKGKAKAATTLKRVTKRKAVHSEATQQRRGMHTTAGAAGSDSEGEFFDLNAISSGTDSERDDALLVSAKTHVSRPKPRTKPAPNRPLPGPSRIYSSTERTFSAREAVEFLDNFGGQAYDHSSPPPDASHLLADHIHGIPSPHSDTSPSSSRRRARPQRFDATDQDQQEQKRRRTLSPIQSHSPMPMYEDFSEDEEVLVLEDRPPASLERIRDRRRRGVAEEDDELPLASGEAQLRDDGQALDLLDRMSTLSVSSPAPSPPPTLRYAKRTSALSDDVIEISD
ncbi:unnamed protein product [Peniophora sp. CBMAI 1063]|nr:unnamed protein product [Peniophora sp. CBMAI 1063]